MATKRTSASKPKSPARRAGVANGIIAGKSNKEIADELGVHRNTVSRDKGEHRLLIDQILDQHTLRIATMVDLALIAIMKGLTAQRKIVISKGKGLQEVVDGGDDFYAQMGAVGKLKDLCLANRPVPKSGGDGDDVGIATLDQLRARAIELKGGGKG